MKRRSWHKKKRFWALLVPLFLFLLSETEWAKMRYQIDELRARVIATGQQPPIFKTQQKAGKTIHYLQIGHRPSFPLVVFVHGSPGALNAYEAYFSDTLLSRQVDMIAVDRPGFGYSDFGESVPSLAAQAGLIARILEAFPERKKILVGHSMGGPVIARLVMDYPELVDGLVMVAPSISPDLEPSNTWRQVVDCPPFRWLTPAALRVCNQELIPLRQELNQMMANWANIRVPITVVQGTEDRLVPAGNADFAKKMMPENTQVKTTMIENGDHFILWSEVPRIKEEIIALVAFR